MKRYMSILLLPLIIFPKILFADPNWDTVKVNKEKMTEFVKRQKLLWSPIAFQTVIPRHRPRFSALQEIDENNWEKFFEKLDQLIKQHPSIEFQTSIKSALDSKELIVVFTDYHGIATFLAVKGKELLPEYPDLDSEYNYGMLNINAKIFAEIKSPYQVGMFLLLIVHEYEHFLDYSNAKTEKYAKHFTTFMEEPSMDEFWCTVYWQTERRAFYKECETSVEWNLFHGRMRDICIAIENPKAFNQRMWFPFIESRGARMPQCIETWAKLAGHPKPEEADIIKFLTKN